MTETTACCGRCSRTIEDTPIGVSMNGGPLHSIDAVLRICPECAAFLHSCPDGWSEIVAMVHPRVESGNWNSE